VPDGTQTLSMKEALAAARTELEGGPSDESSPAQPAVEADVADDSEQALSPTEEQPAADVDGFSDEAIEQREYKESMVLLTSAIEKKGDEHRLHFAMAKTQFLAGERDAAQTSLSRARELAPDDLRDSYNKPLHELVQTGQSGVLN